MSRVNLLSGERNCGFLPLLSLTLKKEGVPTRLLVLLIAFTPFLRQKGCFMSSGSSGFSHRPKEASDVLSFFFKAAFCSERLSS
ncbi:hypothetical protein EUGRSUZ_H02726 [Eucalyptus grandis]|uniref:Uncharacterized protein n=2 Tax=Eucalyptus grandis TaxID=71139 RepID=A0ACC3JRU6_EUCGR|nr:hypothetical protein EUGRSUZ_H02726 [Eucalyptus grandis]